MSRVFFKEQTLVFLLESLRFHEEIEKLFDKNIIR